MSTLEPHGKRRRKRRSNIERWEKAVVRFLDEHSNLTNDGSLFGLHMDLDFTALGKKKDRFTGIILISGRQRFYGVNTKML